MKKELKIKVSFVDKQKERFNVKIEVKDDRFSMSSDNGQHKFVPANEAQQKLLNLWDCYHLNDMNAGTIQQETALESEEFKTYFEKLKLEIPQKQKAYDELMIDRRVDGQQYNVFKHLEWEKKMKAAKKVGRPENIDHYTAATFFLEHKKLLVVPHPETGEPYAYGSEWLMRKLPKDIQKQIKNAVKEILAAEKTRKGKNLNELDEADLIDLIKEKTDFNERDAELACAFVKMFDLSEDDFGDIEIDGTRCRVQGIDYIAGTDEECTEAVTENIRQSLWAFNTNFLANQTDLPEEVFKALQPQCEGANDAIEAIIEKNSDIESFVEAAVNADGRAHFLNHYDGTEESVTIEGTKYFAYRN